MCVFMKKLLNCIPSLLLQTSEILSCIKEPTSYTKTGNLCYISFILNKILCSSQFGLYQCTFIQNKKKSVDVHIQLIFNDCQQCPN